MTRNLTETSYFLSAITFRRIQDVGSYRDRYLIQYPPDIQTNNPKRSIETKSWILIRIVNVGSRGEIAFGRGFCASPHLVETNS